MKDFDPQPGEIYSFATTPATEFSASETGRYAALKVIGVKNGDRVFATLSGIWNEPPTFDQAAQCEILARHAFAWEGRLAVSCVDDYRLETESLSSPTLLGTQVCTDNERKLVNEVRSWSPLAFINSAAEGEWRWVHDHAAYVVEVELESERRIERYHAHQRRIRERLSKLTFEQLLAETPFPKWNGATSYPPAEFTDAAREKIHGAYRQVVALGTKPRKAEVRKVLKETVEWFNEADNAAGGVIETDERDDIYAALEELAYAAKQKSLIHEIDDWREW